MIEALNPSSLKSERKKNMQEEGHPLATLALDYWHKAAKNAEEWKNWEIKAKKSTKWISAMSPLDFNEDYEYRRKTRLFILGGITVPMPEEYAPKIGSQYYYPEPGLDYYSIELEWTGDHDDYLALRSGFVHLTRSNGDCHGRAMCKASQSCLATAGFSPEKSEEENGSS